MANVNIKFNNKEFLLSCEDGQEEHLEELSSHLNEKFDKLKSSLGNIGENKLLLITSITTMDEYFETRKKVDQKIEELRSLTKKFKELKSLVYEYKEKKEKEIDNLNEEQKKLKNQLDENKLEYEKIIEKAAHQIENFLTKVDSENSLQ
jgi:cell division protein ZapA